MERIEEEKAVVEKMIRLYCRKIHGEKTALCKECGELLIYSHKRLTACRFGNTKPTCRKCTIHCYRPDMKTKVREVMRWAGPRMMLHYPADALRHLIREFF